MHQGTGIQQFAVALYLEVRATWRRIVSINHLFCGRRSLLIGVSTYSRLRRSKSSHPADYLLRDSYDPIGTFEHELFNVCFGEVAVQNR